LLTNTFDQVSYFFVVSAIKAEGRKLWTAKRKISRSNMRVYSSLVLEMKLLVGHYFKNFILVTPEERFSIMIYRVGISPRPDA
jgi:hypothetical protein